MLNKKTIIIATFLCLLIVGGAFCAYCDQTPQSVKRTKKSSLEWMEKERVDDYLKRIHFNGTAVIVKDGKTILNKGFGFSDVKTGSMNNPETVYYIGSITKSFVSTAFMQLQEEGKVNINDRLSEYFPSFPYADDIKLYHLLTHTSGLPYRSETSRRMSKEALLKKIEMDARFLLFPPGTEWNYSDSNYTLLGLIIEKVSGETLHQYIKDHIFQKAGMHHSGFGEDFRKEKHPSTGYFNTTFGFYKPAIPHFSQLLGCGDIYMTAYDLYKFDNALRTGKLVSKNSYQQINAPFKAYYGFGWYVNRDKYYSHGVMPGFEGMNGYSRDGRIYVVLLSNVQHTIPSFRKVNNQIFTRLENGSSTMEK
ncbi:serine hydrolase domain-containing protein [Fictibacillus sp. Mic-4]|uniref:serine hydrolase domain-containing protein n=1 Tax=Fictibacillus sp. Mic-4 TaxID=3132826 RepID=UPI003CF8FED7